jgi:hypothetical protein
LRRAEAQFMFDPTSRLIKALRKHCVLQAVLDDAARGDVHNSQGARHNVSDSEPQPSITASGLVLLAKFFVWVSAIAADQN